MRNNTKIECKTLYLKPTPEEAELVVKLKKKLKIKTNSQILRCGLLELEEKNFLNAPN